jgi:hypothetical protein
MQIAKNKTMATIIALFLMLTIAITLVAVPIANAHDPPWTIPTWQFIACSPNPVGVGQQMLIFAWTNVIPPSGFSQLWHYYIDIVLPDGTTETFGPIKSDTAGSGFSYYTPTQVGTYKMKSRYEGFTIPAHTPPVGGMPGAPPTDISNDTYLPAVSSVLYVTVQQEKIPEYVDTPLPTGFWTRPINAVNRNWIQVAGNWLGTTYGAQKNGSTTNFAYGAGPTEDSTTTSTILQGLVGIAWIFIQGKQITSTTLLVHIPR